MAPLDHQKVLSETRFVHEDSGRKVIATFDARKELMHARKKIVFVGGFGNPSDGSQGGQIFACRSLVSSKLSELTDFILVDSAQEYPPPAIWVRLRMAVARVFRVTRVLLFSRVDGVLVFSNLLPLGIAEKALICVLAAMRRKRVVLAIRSQAYFPRRFVSLYRWIVRLAFRSCSAIVIQSEALVDEFEQQFGFPREKARVIPNWIDVDKFGNAVLADVPIQETEPILNLIFLGWLNRDKGIDVLLNAVALLRESSHKVQLHLYGRGECENEFKNLASQLNITDSVIFHGWIKNEDVPKALGTARLFVFPSFKEGMPNSLLQAMACGLPVIGTRIPGISALVTDFQNGILVTPGSISELADAIRYMIEHPMDRIQMGLRNAQKIVDHHSIDSAWPKIASILFPPSP
jgi:glycosyltransferase involved in cell wall biosynthesis